MDNEPPRTELRIGLVGPCKSGKSVLKDALAQYGYSCRHIAQEHSNAPSMWQKISQPDVLIYLDVSYQLTMLRGKLNWAEKDYQRQITRLAHARQHADFYIDTNALNQQQVLTLALEFLKML